MSTQTCIFSKASLPIKWLAPEILATLKSGPPTYDKSSDAWSFGITVWEIYSKGFSYLCYAIINYYIKPSPRRA